MCDVINDMDITGFEKQFEITLPSTYLEFVRQNTFLKKTEFDYFDVDDQSIFTSGISFFLKFTDSQSPYDNITTYNHNPPEFFPENIIAFGVNGGGDSICFDYRQDKDNSNPPIVYWSHEADIGKDVSFVAHNFEEFLGMLYEAIDEDD